MSIGIVILNYINYEDTIYCVSSILKQSVLPEKIVIVENGSENNSLNELRNNYCKNRNVVVLASDKNVGFSKGNNIGIKYLRNIGIDNVLILNNDILLIDTEYLKVIGNIDFSEDVAAVGTRVINEKGENQNPIYIKNSYVRILRIFLYNHLNDKSSLYTLLKKIIGFLMRTKGKNSKISRPSNSIESKHYMLHGSAILLTGNFFRIYDGLYPKTFLYFEENILDIMLEKANLKKLFFSSTEVLHKEDRSTIAAENSGCRIDKEKFYRESSTFVLGVKFSKRKKLKKKIHDYMKKISIEEVL